MNNVNVQTIKNIVNLKLKDITATEVAENPDIMAKLIDLLKDKIAELFLQYEEVVLVLNDFDIYYILTLVDEFNKNNISILYREYVEDKLSDENKETLKNFGVEILMDYKTEKEKWENNILEILEKTKEEILKTGNMEIIIHPVYEILLRSIYKKLGEENFKEIDFSYYIEDKEDKEKFIKSLIVKDIEKYFPEFFENKILIK